MCGGAFVSSASAASVNKHISTAIQFNSLIGNVYRSPNSTQENDIELYKLLHYIQQKFTVPKLIVGDFNFCNITWYDALMRMDSVQLLDVPTSLRRN